MIDKAPYLIAIIFAAVNIAFMTTACESREERMARIEKEAAESPIWDKWKENAIKQFNERKQAADKARERCKGKFTVYYYYDEYGRMEQIKDWKCEEDRCAVIKCDLFK